jgi:hypothetical protein
MSAKFIYLVGQVGSFGPCFLVQPELVISCDVTFNLTFIKKNISALDIPSADTYLNYNIPLSQRLSALDRVVTHTIPLSQRLSASDRVVTHTIPLLHRLSFSDRVVTQPYNKYSSQILLHPSADPTVYHIIYPGDTTHKMPEDCCLEGWPSLQCLLCLDICVCHIACVCFLAIQLLTAALLIHSSLANESNLNCWEHPSRTVSHCMSVHSRLRRFVTPTLDFDKRVWFS